MVTISKQECFALERITRISTIIDSLDRSPSLLFSLPLITRGPVGLTRIAILKTKACDSTGCIAVVLQKKSSNIVWRPQKGGMCPVVSAGKKRTVSSKVDAKLDCSILKVS